MKQQIFNTQVQTWKKHNINVKAIHSEYEWNDCGGHDVDVIMTSPEMARSEVFSTFARKWLRSQLCLVAFDEAHVITEWSTPEFRPDYARMSEVLTICKSSVELVLTATITNEALMELQRVLCIEKLKVIALSPDRPEIYLQVSSSKNFDWLLKELDEKRTQTGKVLIYVRSIMECTRVFERFLLFFDGNLSSTGENCVEKRMVEMFSSISSTATKNRVLEKFAANTDLRIVIATLAFGMGIHIADIRTVIVYGLPETTTQLWQQIGRACRDSKSGRAVIFPHTTSFLKTSAELKAIFKRPVFECIRKKIVSSVWHREMGNFERIEGCRCCSVCDEMDYESE